MISLTSIVVFCFAETVIPAAKKPEVVAPPKVSTCQWIFGNGTINSMPKRWRPTYALSTSSPSSTSS
uniref:Secreted protein n=1 Tax=Caenorhabditis tropicalis TaxID=1561998 RepID=A0A1I7V1P0_9PELO